MGILNKHLILFLGKNSKLMFLFKLQALHSDTFNEEFKSLIQLNLQALSLLIISLYKVIRLMPFS